MREDRLVHLGGRHHEVAEAGVRTPPAVLPVRGTRRCRRGVDAVVDEHPAGLRVEPEHHRRHGGLVHLRHGAFRDGLREREGDGFGDLAARMVRPHRDGLALLRVHDGVLRIDDRDGLEQALVLRDLARDHRAELRHGHRSGVAASGPRLEEAAIVGARVVDQQLVLLHGDLAVHLDVLVPLDVVVEERIGLVFTVRPPRDLLAEPSLGEVDHVVDRGAHGLDAVLVAELAAPPGAELRGADLRAEVALVRRRAVVRLEQVEHVAALPPLLHQLRCGAPEPLGPDVHGVGRVAARHHPGGVGVVALDRGEQRELSLREHRREDRPVRQVAAAVVRVVARDHIAVEELVAPEEIEREPDRAHRAQHELGHADVERSEAPVLVEDRRVALV